MSVMDRHELMKKGRNMGVEVMREEGGIIGRGGLGCTDCGKVGRTA